MEKVQVAVTVIRRSTYSGTVTMEKSEFERLDALSNSQNVGERLDADEEINNLLSLNDWIDDELDYVDEFELYVDDD